MHLYGVHHDTERTIGGYINFFAQQLSLYAKQVKCNHWLVG